MPFSATNPAHYQKPGRKQCWDEMEEKFGANFVRIFCKANFYKYMYRYDMKGGVEDQAKALVYKDKYFSLGGTEEDFWAGMEELKQ